MTLGFRNTVRNVFLKCGSAMLRKRNEPINPWVGSDPGNWVAAYEREMAAVSMLED